MPFAMWARDACPVDVQFGGISGGDALFGSAAARDRPSTGNLSSATLAHRGASQQRFGEVLLDNAFSLIDG